MKLLHHKTGLLTSNFVEDLSASTICRRQLHAVINWLKVFLDVKCLEFLFSEENPVPDEVQLQIDSSD